MEVTALITWLITALGGFYMLGTWISRGGLAPGSTAACPSQCSSDTSSWPRPGS
jgi:hypothetical protein